MIIVRNKLLPWKGYVAMACWPFLFVRGSADADARLLRHEEIHARQQKELLVVGFYAWYLAEWLVRVAVAATLSRHRGTRVETLEGTCGETLEGTRGETLEGTYEGARKGTWKAAYRSVSFEREAYCFEGDAGYLERRRRWAFTKFLKGYDN